VHRLRDGSYRSRGIVKVPSERRTDWFYVCFPIERWHEFGWFRSKDTCGRKRL
jgi:hypothetical protein